MIEVKKRQEEREKNLKSTTDKTKLPSYFYLKRPHQFGVFLNFVERKAFYAVLDAAATFLASLLILRAAVFGCNRPLPFARAILLSAAISKAFEFSTSFISSAVTTRLTAVLREDFLAWLRS
jgi:hypothetical protein